MFNLLNLSPNVFAHVCKFLNEAPILQLRLLCKLARTQISLLFRYSKARIYGTSISSAENGKFKIIFTFIRKPFRRRDFFLSKICLITAISEIAANFEESLHSGDHLSTLAIPSWNVSVRLMPVAMQKFVKAVRPILFNDYVDELCCMSGESDAELIRLCGQLLEGITVAININCTPDEVVMSALISFLHEVDISEIAICIREHKKDTSKFLIKPAEEVEILTIRLLYDSPQIHVATIKQILLAKCHNLSIHHNLCPVPLEDIEHLIQFIMDKKRYLEISARISVDFSTRIGTYNLLGFTANKFISMLPIECEIS